MITLPVLAIAVLIYHTVTATKAARERSERIAMRVRAVCASDREQWASLDY